jgi:hypothetical protein
MLIACGPHVYVPCSCKQFNCSLSKTKATAEAVQAAHKGRKDAVWCIFLVLVIGSARLACTHWPPVACNDWPWWWCGVEVLLRINST